MKGLGKYWPQKLFDHKFDHNKFNAIDYKMCFKASVYLGLANIFLTIILTIIWIFNQQIFMEISGFMWYIYTIN